MGYINSNNIIIFPSSNRINSKTYGTNWLTEYNISNIVNQLLGSPGFVITDAIVDERGENKKGPFKFNIKGYYIEIGNTTEDIKVTLNSAISQDSTSISASDNCTLVYFRKDSKSNIRAGIKFTSSEIYGFSHLEGGDGKEVTGGIPNNDSNEGNELILCDSSYNIPQESRINIKHLSELIKSLDNPTINNPTITNGYLNGTFGPTGSGATLKNMTITGATITSSTFSGTITNSTITDPTINGGTIDSTKLNNVTITGDNNYLGGIFGPTGSGATLKGMVIESGYLNGTFGPTGSGATLKGMTIENSTFNGTSYVNGTFGPTGSGNITATQIKGGTTTITAKTTEAKDNIGLLFCIDDGEI